MFDFDASKLLIIGIVALVFIPSKDLPRVLRQIGQFVGKMRRMASDFQTQFMDAMREADLAELKREAEKLTKAAELDPHFPGVRDAPEDKPGAVGGETTVSPEVHTIAALGLQPADQAGSHGETHGDAPAPPLETAPPEVHPHRETLVHPGPDLSGEPSKLLQPAEGVAHPPPSIHDGA